MQPVVAVDLGGTNLRAAFYPQGIPPAERSLRAPSEVERGPEAVLAAMAEAIRGLLPDPVPPDLCVGVAAPGPLDPHAGVVLSAPNLPGWIDVPLRGWLQDALGVPVRIGNDANLAALGEWRYGAGQGVDHLIYLTISTGIGVYPGPDLRSVDDLIRVADNALYEAKQTGRNKVSVYIS